MAGETSRAQSAQIVNDINALFAELDIPLERPEAPATLQQNVGGTAVNGVSQLPAVVDLPATILNQG